MADEQKPESAPAGKPAGSPRRSAVRAARPAARGAGGAQSGADRTDYERGGQSAGRQAREARGGGRHVTAHVAPWLAGVCRGVHFTAATAGCLAATGRFMFPNVLNEPPQQFTIGFPDEYVDGVDERWKDRFGVWVVRTAFDSVHEAPGFYALFSICTHLGCTPNWLAAESKFKCPCHGSGFRPTGINFEGPAPRPLERARIVMAEDGQILIDKSRKFQSELGAVDRSRVVP